MTTSAYQTSNAITSIISTLDFCATKSASTPTTMGTRINKPRVLVGKEDTVDIAPRPVVKASYDRFIPFNCVASPSKDAVVRVPRTPTGELKFQLAKAASALIVQEMQLAHDATRETLRSMFGLHNVDIQKHHIINLASVTLGEQLRAYLGVPKNQVLQLSTNSTLRQKSMFGTKTRPGGKNLKQKVVNAIARYESAGFLQNMQGGSVTIQGHYFHGDDLLPPDYGLQNPRTGAWEATHIPRQKPYTTMWDADETPWCGWLSAAELAGLLGDHFKPQFLNLFSCGSSTFRAQMKEILGQSLKGTTWFDDGLEVNIHSAKGKDSGPYFYYTGENVTKSGRQGNTFDETLKPLVGGGLRSDWSFDASSK